MQSMIEKLLEQKEQRDREFRQETRENFKMVFSKMDAITDKMEKTKTTQSKEIASLGAKIATLVSIGGVVGGAIMSFLQKKFLG